MDRPSLGEIMGEHDGCFCSFVLARVVSLTACPSHSHHEFPDWCPQASGSERVKRPERGADGRTAEQQCWDCNSPYLPQHGHLKCLLGLLCSSLPSSSPSSCPQALQPGLCFPIPVSEFSSSPGWRGAGSAGHCCQIKALP